MFLMRTYAVRSCVKSLVPSSLSWALFHFNCLPTRPSSFAWVDKATTTHSDSYIGMQYWMSTAILLPKYNRIHPHTHTSIHNIVPLHISPMAFGILFCTVDPFQYDCWTQKYSCHPPFVFHPVWSHLLSFKCMQNMLLHCVVFKKYSVIFCCCKGRIVTVIFFLDHLPIGDMCSICRSPLLCSTMCACVRVMCVLKRPIHTKQTADMSYAIDVCSFHSFNCCCCCFDIKIVNESVCLPHNCWKAECSSVSRIRIKRLTQWQQIRVHHFIHIVFHLFFSFLFILILSFVGLVRFGLIGFGLLCNGK